MTFIGKEALKDLSGLIFYIYHSMIDQCDIIKV